MSEFSEKMGIEVGNAFKSGYVKKLLQTLQINLSSQHY